MYFRNLMGSEQHEQFHWWQFKIVGIIIDNLHKIIQIKQTSVKILWNSDVRKLEERSIFEVAKFKKEKKDSMTNSCNPKKTFGP